MVRYRVLRESARIPIRECRKQYPFRPGNGKSRPWPSPHFCTADRKENDPRLSSGGVQLCESSAVRESGSEHRQPGRGKGYCHLTDQPSGAARDTAGILIVASSGLNRKE